MIMRLTATSWIFALRAWIFVALGALLCAMALSAPAGAASDRRVALVVGNGAYTSVPPLANPIRDAKAISAALKRLGFEVVEGYDLNMDAMTTTVREFAQKLDGAKAGIVYYAGHGIAVGDENYLLPVDAALKSEADLDFRSVNVHLILRQMQREERVNVLILDACRDNPFAAQLAGRSRSVPRGLTAIETQSASGILIAFATDPRATALDGEKDGNSPFTAALLKHIETPDVSITTVMDRVRGDVWEATGKKQKPWTNSSIIGEFKMNPTLKLAALDPAAVAPLPGVAAVAPPLPAQGLDRNQMDVKMWDSAERGNTLADYKTYLEAFPTGQFAAFARNRLAKLDQTPAPPAGAVSRVAGAADEALKKEVGSAQTEAAMKLTAKARRELQVRLRLSGFKPGAEDGKFGPGHRKAVREWQESRGIQATGFFTAVQSPALGVQSEPAYRRALAAAPAAPPQTRTSRRPREAAPVVQQRRTRSAVSDDEPVMYRDRERPVRERPVREGRPAGEAGPSFGAVGG